jgi:hypothetical protein
VIKGTVVRQKSAPTGTPGRLQLENGFACDTLELPWKDNEKGKSCTLPDTYRGWVWYSPTLGRNTIRFEDKHGRENCLIHNANFAADQDDLDGDGVNEVTQIHGCTAVGSGYGEIRRKDGKLQFGILRSVTILERLIASLKNPYGGYEEVEITYEWAEGCEP